MDTSHGKYSGPLAALASEWYMNGDQGDSSYLNDGDGSGSVLYVGPHTLTPEESVTLQENYGVTVTEQLELGAELRTAAGVAHSWDSQGFVYGSVLDRDELRKAEADIDDWNEAAQLEAQVEEANWLAIMEHGSDAS